METAFESWIAGSEFESCSCWCFSDIMYGSKDHASKIEWTTRFRITEWQLALFTKTKLATSQEIKLTFTDDKCSAAVYSDPSLTLVVHFFFHFPNYSGWSIRWHVNDVFFYYISTIFSGERRARQHNLWTLKTTSLLQNHHGWDGVTLFWQRNY